MKNKEKYDLKRLYVDIDHDYSKGGVEIECSLRYADLKEPVFKDIFAIDPKDVLFRRSWIDIHEAMIETILEWLEEESK